MQIPVIEKNQEFAQADRRVPARRVQRADERGTVRFIDPYIGAFVKTLEQS